MLQNLINKPASDLGAMGADRSRQTPRRSSEPIPGSRPRNVVSAHPGQGLDYNPGDNRPPGPGLRPRSRSKDAIDLMVPGGSPGDKPSRMGSKSLSTSEHLDQLSILVHTAVVGDDLEALRKIYKQRNVVLVDQNGNTPLHLAARRGTPQIIKFLLKYIPVDIKNSRQETCGHHAAKIGNIRGLKAIVHGGTMKPLTIVCERDRHGMTVLHLAAILGRHDVTAWLVDAFGKILALIKNNYDQTALHFAAAKGYLKSVQALCKLGKQVANIRDNTGATPVFYACQEGHTQCLYYLVNTAKADLTLSTDTGITPLMAAAQSGRLDAVKLIVQREDDIMIDQQAQDGSTVFHMASANGNLTVLEYLLTQFGAQEAVRLSDIRGSSPAHDAAENGYLACLKLLLDSGNDVHLQDEEGQTPYSLALSSLNAECAQYARSLTDGGVMDATSMFARVHSAVAADRLTRDNFDMFGAAPNFSYDESSDKKNEPNSARKNKAKKLGFLRNKKAADDRPEQSNSLVQGEFVLREQIPNGAPGYIQGVRTDDALNHSPLKFRPAQLSFPDIDDDQDTGPRNSDIPYRPHWGPGSRWGNGSNNNNVQKHSYHELLDPGMHRDPGFRSPVGLNLYYGEDSPRDRYANHILSEHERRAKSSTDLREIPPDKGYNASRWHPMSHLIRTPSQLRQSPNGDVQHSSHPSFEGPFHIDRGSRPVSRASSKKKYPAPPPPRPAPTHLNKNGPERTKATAKEEDDIYEETLDIEDVLDEMTRMGNGGELNEATKWTSAEQSRGKWDTTGDGGTFYYTGTMAQDSRVLNDVCPDSPPVDYSPLLANKSEDTTLHTTDRALPPLPTVGTNFQDPPLPQIRAVVEPPPAPPLPSVVFTNGKVRFSDTASNKPLVELISIKKEELKKTYSTNRKSRSRVRTYNRSNRKRKSTVSSKIGDISDVLERSGLMAPYMDHLEMTTGQISMGYESTDSSVYLTDLSDNSRNNSPAARSRSKDSTSRSPRREMSPQAKFTYLPDGILSTPRLKRVEEEKNRDLSRSNSPSGAKKSKSEQDLLQQQRKNAVHEEITRVTRKLSQTRIDKPNVRKETASPSPTEQKPKVIAPKVTGSKITKTHSMNIGQKPKMDVQTSDSFHMDITDDEYNKLQLTLLRRLERPPELPKLNMRSVKQYERVPDPPSELELFFRKRRERQETIGEASVSGSESQSQASETSGRGSRKSISVISRIVELETYITKPNT